MTTCSVLRCSTAPLTSFVPRPGLEVPVCVEHGIVLDTGGRWLLNAGEGVPEENGTPALRLTLLMGDDLPPELTAWDANWSITDQPGLNVTLQIGQQEISFWTSELAAKRLSSFLAAPPK